MNKTISMSIRVSEGELDKLNRPQGLKHTLHTVNL